MGELSIKIRIGEREYPMRVDAAEEELLRIAGRVVNEKMKQYRDQFGIEDKQDLLAMVAFDSIVAKLRSETETSGVTNEISEKISQLTSRISVISIE
jgi:cell division protein ZapA